MRLDPRATASLSRKQHQYHMGSRRVSVTRSNYCRFYVTMLIMMATLAFIPGHPWTGQPLVRPRHFDAKCSQRVPPRWVSQADAQTTAPATVPPSTGYQSTEETFGNDAGRDLFFPGMDSELAIRIIDTPAADLQDSADRYVAAERLKFYPSEQATRALLECIQSADPRDGDERERMLEDKVARRKAVETLGRYEGQFQPEQVIRSLRRCLTDPDHYTIEVAVWSLGRLDVQGRNDILEDIANVLQHPEVNKRIVIQTLTRLEYRPALHAIHEHMDAADKATASAAIAAVGHLGDRKTVLNGLVALLRSSELNVRRAAMEDVTLCNYHYAIPTIQETPNSFVYRSRTIRKLLDASISEGLIEWDQEMERIVDRLIWDHPYDMNLLGMKNETSKSRSFERNIKRLYKNDALYSYLGTQTLAEDYRNSSDGIVGDEVLKSFNDHGYFDYFAAYHVFKTLGWLRHNNAYGTLVENLLTLPPRFFNHQVGAATALAELGNDTAIEALTTIAQQTRIWELKYACMLSAERLGDNGNLRKSFVNDQDWLIRLRARSPLSFEHLRSSFENKQPG